ncbi:MAG: DNA replication and repair protein RecF [Gemmatimonadaceae bacterium]|nr:DNA replication and repair protein RecF [Gemmatimonadaceae bacterium]
MLMHLVARDYRNFTTLDIEIPSSGLVVVGENGHGKTNLLEAVAYLALLRSFRGARDADVVRFGAPAFHVRATLSEPCDWHTVSVGFERSTRRKRATLDGVEQPRLTNALGAVPSVEFSPADVALVNGGPGERRHYLDVMLALSSPAYLQALQQYRAALLRRNAMLKSAQQSGARGSAADDRVSVWEPALASAGGLLLAARHAFVQAHEARYVELCARIGEHEPALMRYHGAGGDSSAPTDVTAQSAALTSSFAQQRANEMRRGSTLIGPHRDDLQLHLGGRDLRTFGSAGQQRSAAIALRLLELAVLTTALGHAPLLLLDDPFAELDLGRAARVLELLEGAGAAQVLLAVPRVEDIPAAFTRLERRTMQRGELLR